MDSEDYYLASHAVGQSVLFALINTLATKGLLTDSDVRELYEQALLSLEERQAEAPDMAHIYAAARETIEEHLRPSSK